MYLEVQGTILGSAIGDALGAPLEILTKEVIEQNFPNFTHKNPEYALPLPGRRQEAGYKAGEWTDDTQLMIPIINSIIEEKHLNPNTVANKYSKLFISEPLRGWGRSTIKSVENLCKADSWLISSEEGLGIGNGAAMKAAPLGIYLYYAKNKNDAINTILNVNKITHKEPGIILGLLQAVAIYSILSNISITDNISNIEMNYFNRSIYSKKIIELSMLNSINDICKEGGVTSVAEQSVPTTIAAFLFSERKRLNPIESLFEIIRYGGDCDTTGAMFGSLVGARHGLDIFPHSLVSKLEDSGRLLELSEKLFITLST